MTEERVKSSAVRREFSRLVQGVHLRPVEVLHYGEPAAMLISIREYDELKYLRRLYNIGKSEPR